MEPVVELLVMTNSELSIGPTEVLHVYTPASSDAKGESVKVTVLASGCDKVSLFVPVTGPEMALFTMMGVDTPIVLSVTKHVMIRISVPW